MYSDGHVLACRCGRTWRIDHHKPNLNRRGRVYCRCHALLGADETGCWDARLLSPMEHLVALRKVLAHTTLALVQLGRSLGLPVWKWIRLSNLAPFFSPNVARHVRVETKFTPIR
jgi:hypothetical protein